jgi:hypothetical protein
MEWDACDAIHSELHDAEAFHSHLTKSIARQTGGGVRVIDTDPFR